MVAEVALVGEGAEEEAGKEEGAVVAETVGLTGMVAAAKGAVVREVAAREVEAQPVAVRAVGRA